MWMETRSDATAPASSRLRALLRDLDMPVGQSFAVTRTPDNAWALRLHRPRQRCTAVLD
jgi:hypothetical protein